MAVRIDWVLLSYRLPREPSTPRITVWRKLRRLGVAQIVDGLVALPLDDTTREQLEWIASDVIEAGGESTIWLGRVSTARVERQLAARMTAEISAEYEEVTAAATAALAADGSARRHACARLRRQLHRIARRDHFPGPQRTRAHRAVQALADRALVTS